MTGLPRYPAGLQVSPRVTETRDSFQKRPYSLLREEGTYADTLYQLMN